MSSTCLIYFSILSGGVLLKKVCLKIVQISQQKPLLKSPFIKVAGFAGSVTLLKKYSNTGVFLWNLRNLNIYFVEHLQMADSGSCKHSIWTCHKIEDVNSTELFRKMKLKPPIPLKKSIENSFWIYKIVRNI